MNDWSDEETDNPLYADDHNFYKVEKWTKDGTKVDRLLYAGNNLDKARDIFAEAIKHRPRIRLTIRQRTRVLQQWPTRLNALPTNPIISAMTTAGVATTDLNQGLGASSSEFHEVQTGQSKKIDN